VREGRHPWDEGTRQLAIRAVDDLKTFVRRARDWSDADTLRARELAATLERAGGRAPAPARVSASLTADAGTRAFVAREGAALASTLARVAEAVRHNPAVTEPVQNLLQQMQPLRGLATLTEYPPLPDLLESIDRAAALAARSAGALPDPGGLLDSAARALTNATRDITTKGRADPDALEVRRFAGVLRAAVGLDRPELPIEALYAGGDAAPVVEPAPAPHSLRLGQVELTALGEHLKQIGVSVAAAGSLAQRELRILALVDPLRALESGVPDEMQDAVHVFARSARDAIAQSTVLEHSESLGHAVQEAGIAVASMSAKRLALVTEQITRLLVPLEAPPPLEPVAVAPEPAPAARPTPVATPAPTISAEDLEREAPDLAGSLLRYERLVATHGWGTPSLSALISADGGAAAPAAPPAPAVPVPPPPPPAELTPIENLCYSGRAALERALGLRGQVRELIAAGAPAEVVEELLEEVFDLVRLGSADVA
jgi:hypothetical protein